MSGHSKWASIKHKKAATDAKRGQLFTKLIKEITVAARHGGRDIDKNPRLRTAIDRAKQANMPADNIDRAVKKGTGELEGVNYEEFTIEGYGPGGVAIMVELLTDNRNRTTADIRNIFSKKNGSVAGAGSVSWMFEKKGYIEVGKTAAPEDKIMSVALDAGAQDMETVDESYSITTDPKDFEAVKKALEDSGIKVASAEITMIPKSTIQLKGDEAKQIFGLMEALEDHDDSQNVYANFDIPDDTVE
ncbi:MAG: YebC/PmpR family DNA-binding transcriptional regulator [Candidatus Omnitrophica bacterium]|nr:YebC/PmpR family DNA-binding transcriptional regulator [Candidatus Omnitrophota bacterium]MBU1932857.1 YebC/PmpR family DNA-binding transcriptional regulator [Candidatus Omnitrophota bacterium]